MATYNVWVGGENSWNRSYLGEVGWYPLSEAQSARWISEDEDDLDTEAIAERLHRDWGEEPMGEDDFPTRDEVENGCLGYGAYTDQTFGVSRVNDDGEEEIIWSGNYNDLAFVEDADDEEDICPRRNVTCEEPGYRWEKGECTSEPGVAYHHCFKGGWGSEVELPDEEEFDVRKLHFDVLEVEGLAEIVTSFSYNGEHYSDDNGSDGKSCDWYLVHNGEYYSL